MDAGADGAALSLVGGCFMLETLEAGITRPTVVATIMSLSKSSRIRDGAETNPTMVIVDSSLSRCVTA